MLPVIARKARHSADSSRIPCQEFSIHFTELVFSITHINILPVYGSAKCDPPNRKLAHKDLERRHQSQSKEAQTHPLQSHCSLSFLRSAEITHQEHNLTLLPPPPRIIRTHLQEPKLSSQLKASDQGYIVYRWLGPPSLLVAQWNIIQSEKILIKYP